MSMPNRNMSAAAKIAKATQADVETVKRVFDKHPEDVISPIKNAGEALGWLEEIFRTIRREAGDPRNSLRTRRLAELGEYVASDMGEYVACEHEQMIGRLIAAGIVDRSVVGDEVAG